MHRVNSPLRQAVAREINLIRSNTNSFSDRIYDNAVRHNETSVARALIRTFDHNSVLKT